MIDLVSSEHPQSGQSLPSNRGIARGDDRRRARNAAVCGMRAERGHWTPKMRSEEHTSELQSLMRSSYAVFCLKKNNKRRTTRDSEIYLQTIRQHERRHNSIRRTLRTT